MGRNTSKLHKLSKRLLLFVHWKNDSVDLRSWEVFISWSHSLYIVLCRDLPVGLWPIKLQHISTHTFPQQQLRAYYLFDEWNSICLRDDSIRQPN
jgi:hypothetical protein